MNKAKLIAISGMCGAMSVGCVLLIGLIPALKWLLLFLGVLASVAVVIPIILDPRNLVYTLLVYLATAILGVVMGAGNIVCVAPIVSFCIPFAIVKVCGETMKVTATVNKTEVLEDPFGTGDDKQVVEVKVDGKPRINKVVKWVLYYVLLEVGIGLTLLATYFLTPAVFDAMVHNDWFYWVLGIMQLVVFPYDLLLRGCLIATAKVLHKAVKPQ